MPDQPCSACGGRGGTFKTEYTVVTGPDGKQTTVTRQIYSPCSSCGGSGRIA